MPQTLKRSLRYRLAAVHFVKKHMTVSITASVTLNNENVSDLCLSVLAEALHRQSKSPGLAVRDFDKLTIYIERVKVGASGLGFYGGQCAVVHSAIRPESQGTEPGSLTVLDFTHRAILPKLALGLEAVWAAATAHVVLDPHWNQGRFSHLDIPVAADS